MTSAPAIATSAPATAPIKWSDMSRDDKLSALASMGNFATTDIAACLGTTRNAVLGFRRRQGLSSTADQRRRRQQSKTRRRLKTANRLLQRDGDLQAAAEVVGLSAPHLQQLLRGAGEPFNPKRVRVRFKVYPLPPPETWAPVAGPRPLSIMEVNEHTCRWPIEVDGKPAGYCGDHVHAKSYCATHYAMAYVGGGR
jgi:hypothetical protein